jgi:hypothetical protein
VNDGNNIVLEKGNTDNNKQNKREVGNKYPLGVDNAFVTHPQTP